MSAKTLLATSLALAPLLAACSVNDDFAARTTARAASSSAMTVAGAQPLAEALVPGAAMAALPPEAGAVVSVVQTCRSDGYDQKITLVGDAGSRGDNEIAVQSRRHQRGRPTSQVDEASIQAEMAERLPGVAMAITSDVVVSPAGPIGIATGRTGTGVTCVYAWTTGAANRARTVSAARLLGIDGPESNDVDVRVRLCRRGAGEEQLAALAANLRLRTDLQPTAAGNGLVMRPTGSDALATAGYASGTYTAAPSFTLPRSTEAPVYADTPVKPPARQIAAPVAAPKPVAAAPRVVARAPAVAAPRPATTAAAEPAAPPVVAAPIPLPSGG